jgi:hypothetical protein
MDLTPAKYNLVAVTQGDTYPATNVTISGNDTVLSRVRLKIKLTGATTTALTLDSNSAAGITLTATAAGTWAFTIDAIPAATMQTLTAGSYSFDLETTDASGVVKTEFKGNWQILPQITS